MGNESSTSSKSSTQEATKVSSIDPRYVQGKPSTKAERVHHHGVNPNHHGKQSLDNDDTFTDYIQRAKKKLRSMSSIGGRHREQSNPAPDDANDDTIKKKKENHKDHFSDFIQHAKKKLRTTSSIGKNISFKRG